MPEPQAFGRYELVAEIGRGGMAQLYLARLVGIAGFAKPLAIKRILPHLTEDERFVDMFLNEGRIAAKLSHPNICQVFELGEVDGELFLAMEYLEGVVWGELLATATAIGSVRDPVAILRLASSVIGQACDGLHYAHELHDAHGRPTPVVHRDISPGNLFVTVDGACKVLDFGVSKIATEQHQTRSGMVKGKLAYMPPEQIKGESVDARVDVFATAVVLWEALAGARLFARANDYGIIKAVLEEPIPPLAHLFPDVLVNGVPLGRAVDLLLARGLERDRDRRTPTIRAFADELRALVVPLGGVPSLPEVGGIVRDSFASRLDERARLVAQVTAIRPPVRDFSDDNPSTVTRVDGEAVAPDNPLDEPAAPTASIAYRAGTKFALERAPRRPAWPFVVGGLSLLAIVAMLISVAVRRGAAPPPIDAAVATAELRDAAIDAALDGAIAAAPIDPEIVIEPAGSAGSGSARRPRPRIPAGSAKPDRPDRDERPGFYSVDSNPYATIFIDGKRRDQTPLYRVELAPGRHQVKAVLANGKSRTFTIEIAPGRELTSGTLRW